MEGSYYSAEIQLVDSKAQFLIFLFLNGRSPCDVNSKVLDCDIAVNEFGFHLHNNVHFWTYTFGKGIFKKTYTLQLCFK